MPKKLWQSPTVVPEITYDDVPAAIEFLTRAFGLRERVEARLTGNGFVRAFMELGDGLISLSTGGEGRQSSRAGGATTQSVKCYVDGIDRHFAQAKANGANIISEPADEFWGGRIYRAKDPEGHHWMFSERDRELAASKWKLPPGVKLGA
jgi:uncharacterized glyoxalase superfamily protein PhnB